MAQHTLQIGHTLVDNRGQIKLAIKAAIAHLIAYYPDTYNTARGRRLAARQVLWVANKYLDWGNKPGEVGRDYAPEGWYRYAQAIQKGRANAQWPSYSPIKGLKDAILDTIRAEVASAKAA